MPRVSVIMAVNNTQTYLPEAIESILNQTFTDFEFLIITEPGTNHTIIDAYADTRIQHIKAPQIMGLQRCLNVAIRVAKGEYVARMDADDISFPRRLEREVTFLDEHQDVEIVGTGYETIDESGRTLSISSKPSSPELTRWLAIFENPIVNSSSLIRTEVMRRLGGYDLAMIHAEDYDFWIRALEHKTNIVNLPDILAKYRSHSASHIHAYANDMIHYSDVIVKRYVESVYGSEIPESTVSVLCHRSKQTPRQNCCAAETLKKLCAKFSKNNKISEKERNIMRNGTASRLYVIALNIRREDPLLSLRVILMIPMRELPRLVSSTIKKLLERSIGRT